jgi:O-acetylhomoserine (thiol)-lyase
MNTPKNLEEIICLHGKIGEMFPYGASSMPVVQSTAFEWSSAEEIEQVFRQKKFGYLYSRISNPTVSTLEERLNLLENGLGTLVTSSGMSAISVALLTVLKQGDEFISGNSLFAGTYSLFVDVFSRFGIRAVFVETTDVDAYKKAITEKTKLIFLETIGNPKMDVPDIQAISKIAHESGIPLFLDNTVGTPHLWKAKDFGADVIIHSVSKWLNGNGNAIGGSVTDAGSFTFLENKYADFATFNKKFGKLAFLAKMRKEIFMNLGTCLGPHNAFLQLVGLETFPLRMEKHCANARAVAELLSTSKKVKQVKYPGLKNSPYYAVAQKQFGNLFGGMLCFDLETKEAAFRFINGLKFVKKLANIGDARTLALHPASTIYCEMTAEQKILMGVTEGLVRVSVGLEDSATLLQDFTQALEKIAE